MTSTFYPTPAAISTARLSLLCCTLPLIDVVLQGDEVLARTLDIVVPDKWTEFGEPVFRYTQEKLLQPGALPQWWCYLPVLNDGRILVGTCGFKGSPINGVVEIGYEVAAAFRGRGLATEMAQGLIHFAFEQDGVTKVQAHTLAEINESGSVLSKCGMQKVAELEDPEDGKIWRWEVLK